MPKSIIWDCSKKAIDDATARIIGILKSGRKDSIIPELKDGIEREKNQAFLRKYGIRESERKELLLKHLKSQDICDVQIDERIETNRHGNLMYIYGTDFKIKIGEKTESTVKTYIKIEILAIKSNRYVLLISFHEPEHDMISVYDELE